MGEVLFPLVLVAVGTWLWWRSRAPATAGAARRYAELGGGDGSFAVEIVGESHYQPALRAAAGSGEVRHECTAELELEDDNAYDDKAVLVTIEGRAVGYLSRSNARAYRKQVEGYGSIVGRCPAVIVGGGKGRSLGVWLDLPED